MSRYAFASYESTHVSYKKNTNWFALFKEDMQLIKFPRNELSQQRTIFQLS